MKVNSTHYRRQADLPIQNDGTNKAMKLSNGQNSQLNPSSGLVEVPEADLSERIYVEESIRVLSLTEVGIAIDAIIENFENRLQELWQDSPENLSEKAKTKIEKRKKKHEEKLKMT